MKHLTKIETARWLAGHDDYCIITHRRPDGDTLGSSAALCRVLRGMGKSAHILANPEMTDKYRALHEGLTSGAVAPGATVVSVDLAAETMFPASCADLTDRVELLIDHHGSNSGYAREGLVEENTAACGEIIYDLMLELGAEMTTEIAEAIYTAVSTDTGCFRYANTTAHTLRVAAACLEAGADTYRINKELFETSRLSRLKLNAYLAQHLEILGDGRIALCQIPLEVEQETGVQEDDMENVSNFAENVEGVKLAVTFRTEPGGATKISARSVPGYNSSAVCAELGGGGHVGAAGARLECGQAQAREQVLKVLKKLGYL